MAGDAIFASLLLAMAIQARSHVVIHLSSNDGHSAHVAMAGRALNTGSHVWRVSKLDMGALVELIDSDPRHFALFFRVLTKNFDSRSVGCNFLVAQHALANRGMPASERVSTRL